MPAGSVAPLCRAWAIRESSSWAPFLCLTGRWHNVNQRRRTHSLFFSSVVQFTRWHSNFWLSWCDRITDPLKPSVRSDGKTCLMEGWLTLCHQDVWKSSQNVNIFVVCSFLFVLENKTADVCIENIYKLQIKTKYNNYTIYSTKELVT